MDYKFPREYMHKFWWKLLGSGISETPFGILLLQSRAFWLISSSHDRMANFLFSTSEVSWGAKWYTRTKSWQVGRSNAMLRIHYWYSMAFPNWPRVYNTTEVFATAPFFWQLLFSAWTASVYTVQFKGLPIWCWTHLLPCNIRTTNMVHALIPAITFKNGFTTSQDMKRDNRIVVVALSDSTLGVHKIYSKTSHNLVVPPKPSGSSALPPPNKAWEAFYPKGSINPGGTNPGGFGFYLSGPASFAKQLQDGAKEVIMSYRVMLQKEWEWVKGGKMPGWCEYLVP